MAEFWIPGAICILILGVDSRFSEAFAFINGLLDGVCWKFLALSGVPFPSFLSSTIIDIVVSLAFRSASSPPAEFSLRLKKEVARLFSWEHLVENLDL